MIAAAAAALMVAGCSKADESPKLEAETGEGYLRVFSTSEKPYRCAIYTTFTYFDKTKNERTPGDYLCFVADRPAGNRVVACEASHENFRDVKVEKVELRNCAAPPAN